MDLLRFVRRLIAIAVALALLDGCGGNGSAGAVPGQQSFVAPSGLVAAQLHARGIIAPPLAFSRQAQSDRPRSWMAPEAKGTPNLLYVADEATNDVEVYSYPAGKLEGTLTGFNAPSGICSNKAGDVFILNGGGSTVEVYAHGGTSPLRTLSLPGYPELNCSVDPTTGNLAVASLEGSCGYCFSVFTNAQGTPTNYEPSGQEGIPGCGYDNRGNLFCDAYSTDNRKFKLFELPARSSNVTEVSVNSGSIDSGPVQWDGKYLAIGSGASGTIYQIALSGSNGTVEGSTQLNGTGWVWQFWIPDTGGRKETHQGPRIIAPTYAGSDPAEAGYWAYPGGGNATKAITGQEMAQPDGATLSTVKS